MPPAPASARAWRLCLLGLVAAAIVLQLTSLAAVVFSTGGLGIVQLQPSEVKELAPGKLLVAARGLPDPNFAESVVVLADYDAKGAMGLIVNRQTKAPLTRVWPDRDPSGADPTVFFGGPVSAPGVIALIRADEPSDDDRRVVADVYLVTSQQRLDEALNDNPAPSHVRVYVGYSGWGPGQLDRETAQGAWHVFDGAADVVFDPEPETVWRRQIRRTEVRLALRQESLRPAN
jgi:putative transcriptional regulator